MRLSSIQAGFLFLFFIVSATAFSVPASAPANQKNRNDTTTNKSSSLSRRGNITPSTRKVTTSTIATTTTTTTPRPLTTVELIQQANKEMGSVANGIRDFRLKMSSEFNWESLLSPAPLSISVLGSLMITSNIAKDFSLENGKPSTGFQFMEIPQSFRATLVQISNTGYQTFLKAHNNMNKIKLHTAAIPGYMSEAVKVLFKRNAFFIQKFLPRSLNRIKVANKECVQLSSEVVTSFHHLLNLTMEVIAVTTAAKGISETKNAEVQRQITTTMMKLNETEKLKQFTENEHRKMSELVERSQKKFEEALDSFPSSGQILAMNFVDGLVARLTLGLSLLISSSGSSSIEGISTLISSSGSSSIDLPNSPDTNNIDSAQSSELKVSFKEYQFEIPTEDHSCLKNKNYFNDILDIWTVAQVYLNESKSNFVSMNSATADRSKLMEIDISTLHSIGKRKTPTCNTVNNVTAIGVDLIKSLEGAFKQFIELKKATASESNKTVDMTESSEGFQALFGPIKRKFQNFYVIAEELKRLSQIGKIGSAPSSSLTGTMNFGGSSAEQAIQNARIKVAAVGEQLTIAQKSAESTREQVVEETKVYIGYLGDMKNLELDKIRYDDIIEIMAKGLKLMSTLKEHWDKLTRFFQNINNVVEIIKVQELEHFRNTTLESADPKIFQNNVLLKATAELIYSSMMKANEASNFVNSMASLYVKVSNKYIMDNVASLDRFLTVDPKDAQGLQAALKENCTIASQAIIELVTSEKNKIIVDLENRKVQMEKAYDFLKYLPAQQEPSEPEQLMTTDCISNADDGNISSECEEDNHQENNEELDEVINQLYNPF